MPCYRGGKGQVQQPELFVRRKQALAITDFVSTQWHYNACVPIHGAPWLRGDWMKGVRG